MLENVATSRRFIPFLVTLSVLSFFPSPLSLSFSSKARVMPSLFHFKYRKNATRKRTGVRFVTTEGTVKTDSRIPLLRSGNCGFIENIFISVPLHLCVHQWDKSLYFLEAHLASQTWPSASRLFLSLSHTPTHIRVYIHTRSCYKCISILSRLDNVTRQSDGRICV